MADMLNQTTIFCNSCITLLLTSNFRICFFIFLFFYSKATSYKLKGSRKIPPGKFPLGKLPPINPPPPLENSLPENFHLEY